MSQNPILSLLSQSDMDIEQKIIQELLNNENLETKTEINKPILWSCMSTIEDFLTQKKLVNSSHVLNLFTQLTFKYLISKDRKGRLEYLEALQSVREKIEAKNVIDMNKK